MAIEGFEAGFFEVGVLGAFEDGGDAFLDFGGAAFELLFNKLFIFGADFEDDVGVPDPDAAGLEVLEALFDEGDFDGGIEVGFIVTGNCVRLGGLWSGLSNEVVDSGTFDRRDAFLRRCAGLRLRRRIR